MKNKTSNEKAQGGLEYLLLIGGAVLVVVIVVTLLLNLTDSGKQTAGANTIAATGQIQGAREDALNGDTGNTGDLTEPLFLLAEANQEERLIELSWTVDDAFFNEDGFTVESRQSESDPWVELADVPENTTTYLHENLNPGNYEYRVYAFNDTGNSEFSNISGATILP